MGMRTFRHLMAVCGLLSLTGCLTGGSSPDTVYRQTSVSYDKYAGTVKVIGGQLYSPGLLERQTSFLVTSLNVDGAIVQSWIDFTEDVQTTLSFFVIAHDDQALPLKVEKIERLGATRGDPSSKEEVAIDLPPGYLESHAATGIDLRVEGRRGSATTKVSAAYVQGYLKKLREVQACMKAKTC